MGKSVFTPFLENPNLQKLTWNIYNDWKKKEEAGFYKKNEGGFYFDNQLKDPSLILSLHPSTKQNSSGEWEACQGGFEPFLNSGTKEFTYDKIPIAVSLLSEDPSFSIGNNFTDFNGGNPLEGIFNQIKPFAPLVSEWGKGLKEATKNPESYGSTVAKYANKLGGAAGSFFEKMGKNLNTALFVQGTRFSYYNGTNFSPNNLDMKFIKFSDWDDSGKEFANVLDYITSTLAPYCYGIYSPLTEDGKPVSKLFGDNKITAAADKFISEYIGTQSPPGGFEMSAKNLDNALFGTLRLNIGGIFAIENLIIKSMNFNLSKVQAKDPTNPANTVPMYAEITLSLAPAGMVTDKSFVKMMKGEGLADSYDSRKAYLKDIMDLRVKDRKTALKRK